MLESKANPFISAPLRNVVSTSVDVASPASGEPAVHEAVRDAWQGIIDHQLIEWGRDPGQIEDEGVEPPTSETIQRAILLAQALRDDGLPAPQSVVPDPNGGIVFERREDNVLEALHVWDDGTTEYRRFHGTKLVERRTI